jgi:hypothetical protein
MTLRSKSRFSTPRGLELDHNAILLIVGVGHEKSPLGTRRRPLTLATWREAGQGPPGASRESCRQPSITDCQAERRLSPNCSKAATVSTRP